MKNKLALLLVAASVLMVAFSGSAPVGRTNAPGESFCTACHTGSNPSLDGEVTISGVPSMIMPSTTYPITVTVTNPNMAANRAGFSMVVLDDNQDNVGDLINNGANSALITSSSNGREYFGHAPAVAFSGGDVQWTVDWVSPASATSNISFYTGAIIANGGSGNSQDRPVLTSVSAPFSGGSPLEVTVEVDQEVTCFGDSDGIATATATGGSGSYTYAWDNGETTQTAVALNGGNHSVTVSDGASDVVKSFFVDEPDELVAEAMVYEGLTCFMTDAICGVNTFGGTSPYTYQWSNGSTFSGMNTMIPGLYQVTVTDANGCTAVSELEVEPAPEDIEIVVEDISYPHCLGDFNHIDITAESGDAVLEYEWSNGATGPRIENVALGSYTVTITNGVVCSKILTYEMEIQEPLSVSLIDIQNETCEGASDGSISLFVEGGDGQYEYEWANGDTTSSLSNISAGTYSYTVTDGIVCSIEDLVIIDGGSSIDISVDDLMSPSCNGADDGSISVSVSGGNSGPFEILWSTGDTTNSIENLGPGTYQLSVTANNGCQKDTSFTISERNNAVLTLDTVTHIQCFGDSTGSAMVSLTGGEGFDVVWSSGDTGLVVNNLPAGDYSVVAIDSTGCQSDTVMVQVAQPDEIQIMFGEQSILCHGGFGVITTMVQGGVAPYGYNWSIGDDTPFLQGVSAGTYSVTVTDSTGCMVERMYTITQPDEITQQDVIIENVDCHGDSTGTIMVEYVGGAGDLTYSWSTGDSTASLDGLVAGTYILTVADTNACMLMDTFVISHPDQLAVTVTSSGESQSGAEDGSAEVTAITGGVAPYQVLWSIGDTTASISGLSPGVYTVTVTDSLGCAVEEMVVINGADCDATAEYSSTDVSCFGANDGTISVTLTPEETAYAVLINGDSIDLSMLEAGIYDLTILYGNNCTISVDSVVVGSPVELTLVVDDIEPASDNSTSDGSVEISVAGGVAPYAYLWVDSTGMQVSTDEDPRDLLPGAYQVTVTDANGCVISLDGIQVSFISNINNLDTEVLLLPNPMRDVLVVQTRQIVSEVVIYDMQGKVVKRSKGNETNIPVGELQNGIYLAKVLLSNNVVVKQLLVK